jgi:hypothetical protein
MDTTHQASNDAVSLNSVVFPQFLDSDVKERGISGDVQAFLGS